MVVDTIKMDAHEAGVRLGHNDMPEGILKVCFPERGTGVLADEIHDGIQVVIVDGNEGRLDAAVYGWQLGPGFARV